jgi:hypothetical protein
VFMGCNKGHTSLDVDYLEIEILSVESLDVK